jgi:type IV pilus assembly protein PilY1
LVNLVNGNIEYYYVKLDDINDNHEVVTADKLIPVDSDHSTQLPDTPSNITSGLDNKRLNSDGIPRSYSEECQSFANWYSFYRRRIYTAKNAIGNVISTMDGVYIGLIFINNYDNGNTPAVPIKVNLNGTTYDDSQPLLNILYGYNIMEKGTPLRDGLKKAGQYYQGNLSISLPSSFPTLPVVTSSSTYPYFTEDKGGSCQQAFTILFTDGYYNGSDPSYIGNADGDNNTAFDGDPFGDNESNTLADVAMKYYENDLNSTLSNDVPKSSKDQNNQQHMVTYTIAFGVTGSLSVDQYKDCPTGTCPASWPSTNSDTGKIDDLFHAAINGRGEFISASNTAELNDALQALKKNIENRLGAAAALATSSIQRTVGSLIYQGTYNSANWYGELKALNLNVTSGEVGNAKWLASEHIPDWQDRTILSYTGSTGIVFDASNLTATQKSQLESGGLGTAQEIVDFIRGDTSNNVSNGGTLRNRTHPLGDIVHSAPTYYKQVVYIGANDGMLHAFDANNGEELFAYVPNLVYDHLAELANPAYSHKYYVDNTANVATVGSQDVLVCGLGKGGKGYFALDVTNPDAMDATNDVLWEYPSSGTTDDDMGYSFSKALIVNTEAKGQHERKSRIIRA